MKQCGRKFGTVTDNLGEDASMSSDDDFITQYAMNERGWNQTVHVMKQCRERAFLSFILQLYDQKVIHQHSFSFYI